MFFARHFGRVVITVTWFIFAGIALMLWISDLVFIFSLEGNVKNYFTRAFLALFPSATAFSRQLNHGAGGR